MIKQLLVVWITSCTLVAYGQSFEGTITYKTEALNPNPALFPDSMWQEILTSQFGESGTLTQQYYYKKGKYISYIQSGNEKGYQAYNPEDGLLYAWEEGSDTAVTINSKKTMDTLVEIIDEEGTDTILGIVCHSILVKSKMGGARIWYNSDYLTMDWKYYKGHIYGHWEQILKHIGCIPLRIEQKGFMAHLIQTAVSYEEVPINDEHFIIPEFKEIIVNPMN